jgi:hypothetical protein
MGVIDTTLGEFIKNGERLLSTIEANAGELAYLDPQRQRLAAMIEGTKDALYRQGTFKGQSQQATRDMEAFVLEGRELVTRLRNGVRSQYGTKTEKLVEFGLQPRRPRRAKAAKAPETAPPSPTSPALKADSSQEGTSDKPLTS